MYTRGTGHPISWRVVFSFLAVLALLSMIPVPGINHAAAESGVAEVSTKEQFETALADSSIHTIILSADIDSGFTPSAKEMPAARRKTVNRVLTIRSQEGQKHTLSGYGFTVDGYSSEAALSFENIIIDGKIPERCEYAIDYSNDYCLMIVHGPKATLNFNDGARVQNFHNQHAAVFLLEDKAVLNVNEGCEMYNLGAGYGIFRVDGRWGYENGQFASTLNITGGLISTCCGYSHKDWPSDYSEGVITHVRNGSNVNMTGGTIENCGLEDQGIGIFYMTNHPNTFKMTGGTIQNNEVLLGGAFRGGGKIIVGGDTALAYDNNATMIDSGKSSFYLGKNQTIIIDDSHLTRNSLIGVYTGVAPTDDQDVKIATGAVMEDIRHFQSDRPEVAGIIYCDGENDWAFLDGIFKLADTHHTEHEAGTIWLTTAANKSELESIIEKEFNTVLIYDANGAESGNTPMATRQKGGTTLTVEGNTGTLQKEGYIFSGWNTKPDGSGSAYRENDLYTINEDTTLYARWIAERLTVTRQDGDGSVLDQEEYNAVDPEPTTDKEATKKPDEKYIYTFSGWADPVIDKEGNRVYKPVFSMRLQKYTVTFVNDDGSVLQKTDFEYGTNPAIQPPEKKETETSTYTFAGWSDGTNTYPPDTELPTVKKDVTYKAVYTVTAKPTAAPAPALAAAPSATIAPTATPNVTAAPTAAPEPTATPRPVPKTGDREDVLLWAEILALCLAMLVVLWAVRSGQRRKQ